MQRSNVPIKRLVKNFMSLSVLRGFDLVAPLVITPYLISRVGIEKFGVLAFAMSVAMYFGMFVQYGFNITAVRDIARSRSDNSVLMKTFSAVFWSNMMLALTAAVMFLSGLLVVGMSSELNFVFGSAFLLVMLQSIMPTWLFQGLEEMGYISMFGVLSKFAYLALVLLFVTNESDYRWVYFYYAVSCFFVLLISYALILLKFGLSLRFPGWALMMRQYKKGFNAFATQISPSLYNNSSVFILGVTASPVIVGAYSAAMIIVEVSIAAGRVASSVMLPYLSLNIHHHKQFKFAMLALGLAVGLCLMVFSNVLSELFFGGDNSIGLYINILAFSIPAAYAYLVFNTNYLMLNGLDREARRIAISVSLVFLLLGVVVIPWWGAIGAAVIVVLARSSMAFLSYWIYRVRTDGFLS